jgi:predicted nucleic acid-binding Zn ribbon protein
MNVENAAIALKNVRGFHDASIVDCPKCSAKSKRILCPAPVLFKGSGFYVTDSGKNPANS